MARRNPDENQIKYWQDRNEKLFLNGEKDILRVAKDLQQAYQESLKLIQKELNTFYGMYAANGSLTFEEAKKLLDKSELKSFKQELKEYYQYAKENGLDSTYKNKIKALYFKTRVSRLEQLKVQIEQELVKLSVNNEAKLEEIFSDIYEEAYYKTAFNVEKNIGFEVEFGKLNKDIINKAINKNYEGVNYSSGIWKNKDNLMNILTKSISQGLALGYNPKKLAEITSKQYQTSYNSTVRLIRTEYNAILNEASFDSYKACGIKQYKILATLDDRTSEICQSMDGEIFDLSEKEVGINFPPFHPNCRTTTIPYFEPDEIDRKYSNRTRLAKENGQYYKVPEDMTYNEWKNKNNL